MSSNPSPKPVPAADDRLAEELRRFGPVGIFAILFILNLPATFFWVRSWCRCAPMTRKDIMSYVPAHRQA